MSAAPSAGPLTPDVQQIDKVEAVNGNVEVTLTATPDGQAGPSAQIRFRLSLADAQELVARLSAAIVTAKLQLRIRRP